MAIKVYNQKKSQGVSPEKVYTQGEVNALLEKEGDFIPSKESEIKKEDLAADKQERDDDRVVAGLVKKSNRILVSISSHAFPVKFFPDTLNVEEGRITIINRHMLSSEVHSVDIKDISNIFINTVIFFSQLIIVSKTFEENEIKITNLLTKEAVFARRIIEGLRVFVSKGIDTSVYSKDELIAKLEELSKTEIVT